MDKSGSCYDDACKWVVDGADLDQAYGNFLQNHGAVVVPKGAWQYITSTWDSVMSKAQYDALMAKNEGYKQAFHERTLDVARCVVDLVHRSRGDVSVIRLIEGQERAAEEALDKVAKREAELLRAQAAHQDTMEEIVRRAAARAMARGERVQEEIEAARYQLARYEPSNFWEETGQLLLMYSSIGILIIIFGLALRRYVNSRQARRRTQEHDTRVREVDEKEIKEEGTMAGARAREREERSADADETSASDDSYDARCSHVMLKHSCASHRLVGFGLRMLACPGCSSKMARFLI